MERRSISARWRGWLQGAWWTLTLLALMIATVEVASSTAKHPGSATTRPVVVEKHLPEGEADNPSTVPNWGWEWQPEQEPGSIAGPTYLR